MSLVTEDVQRLITQLADLRWKQWCCLNIQAKRICGQKENYVRLASVQYDRKSRRRLELQHMCRVRTIHFLGTPLCRESHNNAHILYQQWVSMKNANFMLRSLHELHHLVRYSSRRFCRRDIPSRRMGTHTSNSRRSLTDRREYSKRKRKKEEE